jgi:CrcB protein
MVKVALIALGGAVGAVLRYWIGGWVQQWTQSATFPYGTLVVNGMGCVAIGLLSYWGEARGLFTPESRLLVFTGVLGGFTTFSTFANESVAMARVGAGWPALGNVAAHLVLGLGGVWAGWALGRWLWR